MENGNSMEKQDVNDDNTCLDKNDHESTGNGETDIYGNNREAIKRLCETFPHRVIGQFFYQDVMFTNMTNPELLENLSKFDIREKDVFICGYPKSGTTWLQEIVSLIFHDGDVSKARQTPVYLRVPYFEQHAMQNMIYNSPSPRLIKTHLPYPMLPNQISSKKPKLIYITRNPKDVATSYYYFYKSLTQLGNYTRTFDEYLQMFRAGFVAMGSWFDHTAEWMPHANDPNVLSVTYEEMSRNRYQLVSKVAEFCERDLTDTQIELISSSTSFENMKEHPSTSFSNNKYIDDKVSPFMRKGEIGDWINHFNATQSQDFDDHFEEKLGHLNLKMVYTK